MSDSDAVTKSASQALSDFSKKYASFVAAEQDGASVKIQSSLKSLQDQINEREAERVSLLRRQFMEYVSPLTSDIEDDEENLLKAYKLYCQLVELNTTAGDAATHLRDMTITSPLCKKTEYTSEPGRFPFLRLWFLIMNPDAMYIPEISEGTGASPDFVISFIEKDLWQPTLFEKEIMQSIE